MREERCHCCLSNCSLNFVDLFGQKVIYSEIIKETFNISSEIRKLCSQCVKKLKDAFDFKSLIQKTQDDLQKVHKEIIHPMQPPSMLRFQDEPNLRALGSCDINNQPTRKFESNLNKNKDNITLKPKDNTNNIKIQRATREDSLKLLEHSNICLFKSLKTKFLCYHCKEIFLDMSDLRSHAKIHSNTNDIEFKINLKGNSSKNADISSLTCTLCFQSCNDLNVLKEHLANVHNIEFSSASHMFVPYKLENGFQCVTCNEEFNSFVRLSTHMNQHSTNNVCEICGLFFINRLSLRTHLQSVHREKKCTLCKAKFEKNYNKIKHMRLVHNVGAIRRYCTICGKDFKHSYKLQEHRIKEHNEQRVKQYCKECGKTFLSPQNLKIHIRSVHVKERNYQCNVCGMRFFTRADEKRHERKHDDVKLFSCSYCDGRFKSKDSWRRHLKRIHDRLVVD